MAVETDVIKALHELLNAIKDWLRVFSTSPATFSGTVNVPGPAGPQGAQGPVGATGPAGSGGGGSADYTSLVKWGAV